MGKDFGTRVDRQAAEVRWEGTTKQQTLTCRCGEHKMTTNAPDLAALIHDRAHLEAMCADERVQRPKGVR